MRMERQRLILAWALLLIGAGISRADYIVSVGNLNLAAGSSGYVPVFISSNAGDLLANTNFEFQISTAGATQLQFTNSPAPGSDPTFASSSYVFFGNSSIQTLNFLPLGTTNAAGDTFIGGDSTNNTANVPVPSSNLLLVDLPVTSLTSLPPTVGDTFTISLVPASGSGFSVNTGFGTSDGNDLTFGNFTSVPGTVTIVSAVVPEPASVALGIMAGTALLGVLLKRRRFAQPGHNTRTG